MNATIRSEQIESPEADSNLAAVSEVEEGIREFVRNDIAYLRRPTVPSPETAPADPQADAKAEASVNDVNSLIQRVAGTSLAEIEKLISELESLRDLLHAEGQRVQREISGYAQLSQAAMKSTRMIADNVNQWKRAADGFATADYCCIETPPPSTRRRRFFVSKNLRFELCGRRRRPRAGRRRRAFIFGTYLMESIRPNQSEPIPVQASSHHVGTILIRFVGILFVAVAVLALLWSR